ncbi:4-hydroxyphenylacetate decarboxylase small subunit [Bacteroidota bacterium]
MNSNYKHIDCRNFAALDVAKGICHLTKDIVIADEACCENFEKLSRCKFCINYSAEEEYTGICNADQNKPMAYPDMIAVTCENFKWLKN